ncbi:hypothetical protein IP88_03030 [alpha proteobacterium AAP81b]|nr:hypothetical protein IP88_03030 [alpha proteobacterium AAP81b]
MWSRVLALALLPTAALAFPLPDRPVARVVSPIWADEDSRDSAGEVTTVIKRLGIKAGQTVADIGAGSGYYTVRLSPVVGPGGRVIAEDITPRYLDRLKSRVRRAGLGNVRFVLGGVSDPKLPAGAVDVALMIHMYHEIQQPYALLWNLRRSLKPDGLIGIVDLDRGTERHGTPRALLACEVGAVGYKLVSITDLDSGYLAVFRAGPPVDPASIKACRGQQ